MKESFENKLCLVTNSARSRGRKTEDVVKQAIEGGVDMVILRERSWNPIKLREEAIKLAEICRKNNVLFLVGDSIEIAVESKADGVHLQRSSLDLSELRHAVGDSLILGASASSIESAVEMDHMDIDYIMLEPIYGENEIGEDAIGPVLNSIHKPLIVFGGIELENLPKVMEEGASTIAISDAILLSNEIKESVAEFAKKIKPTE